MEEEIQNKLLEKIEDISERKEVITLYKQVFQRLAEYQEEQLNRIYGQAEKELSGSTTDYTVTTILCKSEDVPRFWDGFVPVMAAGRLEACWGKGAIERIYIEAENAFLLQVLEKNAMYSAVIQTNYETYPVSVVLKKASEGLEQAEKINKLMVLHGVELPEVNDICFQKFYDVCFGEVKDRLREDEKIESIQVEWGELKPYIRENVSLLWNVKKVTLKENAFPSAVNLINEIRYDHEMMLPRKESAYLAEIPEGEVCQVVQTEQSLRIRNIHKEYQNWEVYEIRKVKRESLKNEPCEVITNGVRKDIFTGLQNSRALYTKSELYRRVMSYEMVSVFRRIEIRDGGNLLFYPREPKNYLNADIMEFIMKDLSELYGSHRLTGRMVEDGE